MTKILIVEDDTLVSRMYTKILNFNGFEVETAANGEEGLQKVKSFMPELVLLDIMMPKVNGVDMLKNMKKDPETKNISVVVLTNLASDAVINEAFELGVDGYLIKSEINNDKVVEEIKQYINKKTFK